MNDATLNAPASDAGLLNIQVHLDRVPHFDKAAFKAACEKLVEAGWAIRLSFAEVEDDGAHIDAGFETFHAQELWVEIERIIYADALFGADLRSGSIAIRTGAAGWDDYVILSAYEETADAQA